MKKIKNVVLFMLLFVFLVGCTNDSETVTPVSTPTLNVEVNDEIEVLETEDEIVEEEFDESLLMNPVFNILQELMTNTLSTENVSYYTYTDDTNYFISQDDSADENYVTLAEFINGYIDTENAYVDTKRSYVHQVAEYGSPHMEMIDSFEAHIYQYLNAEQGKYFYTEEENIWYKEELGDQFKTIDNMVALVDFFILHIDLVELEKITDSDDPDYGKTKLSLMITPEMLAENIVNLQMTFFNGYYDEYTFDYSALIEPSNITNQYVTLLVDENSQLAAYHLYYSEKIPTGSEEDYHSYFMRTDFFEYNNTSVESVPEKGLSTAVQFEYYD